MSDEFLTFGLAAVRIGGGVQRHHIDRLARRQAIPFKSSGRFRLIAVADLPAVREACERAGYLKALAQVAA